MTARIRRSLTVASVALALLASACDVLPSASLMPTPDAGLGSSQPPGPLGPEAIATAIGALDGLESYRLVGTTGADEAGVSEVRATVVNGPVRRTRIAYSTDGAVSGATITIGSRTWVRVSGATYREQDGGEVDPNDWVNPVARLLDPWSLGMTVVDDVGLETRGAVPVRHLVSRVMLGDVVDDDGIPVGNGFEGTVDAWIAVDGGYLVAARAVGTETPPTGAVGAPSPSATPWALEIAVEGVDDPANVIEVPVSADGPPVPIDDEVAMRLIRAIPAGQASLDSYVYSITASISGFDLASRLTVVNRPVAAAQVETDAVAGFETTTILAVGDRTWSRTGAGDWLPARGGERPACGLGGDATSDLEPCSLARLTDIGASIRTMRDSFAVISRDARVAGIPVTHLRSEAGVRQGGDVIPGTRDVWIANDGGYLVRDVFIGPEISFSMVIGRINDAQNVLAAPVR